MRSKKAISQFFEYLEYSGWNVGAVAFIGDNHIGWIRPVKLLIGAENVENCQLSVSSRQILFDQQTCA